MGSLEATRSLYARTLSEPVFIRRYTGTGSSRPKFDTPARAQMRALRPIPLVGGAVQTDFEAIVLTQDLVDGGFPLPITTDDKLVRRETELAITFVDDATRSIDGVTVAHVLTVRG